MEVMERSDLGLSMASPSLSSSNLQTPYSSKPPEMSPSILRLWRPQAQRNLRNQWSKLSALRHDWLSSSSAGRSHATSLINSHLSHRYMDAMDLGVLSDMRDIRKKACYKLEKQLELHRSQLLSSYKAMVAVVIDMLNASRSMRCFLKAASGSPLIQFSSSSEDSNDAGDGGGIRVFKFLAIHAFEVLAEELVEMFKRELILKRCLVVELLYVSGQKIEQFSQLSWADELYHGEADDLNICHLFSEENAEPLRPKIDGFETGALSAESDKLPNHEVLEIYLTTWLAEVNVDTHRVEEIFDIVGEEMGRAFS